MLSKSVIPCQNGRLSARRSIRVAGRQDGDRPELLKKRAGELSVWSISPPLRPFLCGKNEISLLKEISFLPQRREFLAARKFPEVWKGGKNGASGGFFFLFGGCPRAKSDCLFASLPPRPADAGAVSVRTAFLGSRQSGSGNRIQAFILFSRKPARFAHFRPSPPLLPSARFSRGRS